MEGHIKLVLGKAFVYASIFTELAVLPVCCIMVGYELLELLYTPLTQ